MVEVARCSFCDKPRVSVLHLFIGPGGYNICDECVAKGLHGGSASFKTQGNCSFCGRNAVDIEIALSEKDALVCLDCLTTCREHMSDIVGSGTEFLAGDTLGGSASAAIELMELVRSFARHSYKFDAAFRSGDINWAAHNEMEQLLHPMRSKAGRLGNEEITDTVWRIEQLFTEIDSHDMDANAPRVKKLSDLVDHLISATKRASEE